MRILVVEDEQKIADAIKKGLEQESYAVDIANDGAIGLDLAQSEDYDLILLDVLLPHINGIDVCKKLRSEHIHTPILLLTAKGQLADKVMGLNSGADDYVTKPFEFEELLARIRALIRRPQHTIGSILATSDLSMDTNTFEVRRNEMLIHLSNKEYALLEFLLRNKESIVTKNQIIAHVWNFDSDVLPNTVEVYIGYLRNKIDKAFPQKAPLIYTVRGFGYKITKEHHVSKSAH